MNNATLGVLAAAAFVIGYNNQLQSPPLSYI
jgi:hypothetical protein